MSRKSAFTLIELLTVLAIISILSSMLFPSLARAREGARRVSCSSNLRQIGMAVSIYIEDYDERYPLMENQMTVPADQPVTEGCPASYQVPVSWAYSLQPYLKNNQIFICPSVTEIVDHPGDSVASVPLWNDCVYPSGGGGGGRIHGGGGAGPTCPPMPKYKAPQPSYAFNTMMKYAPAWQHTAGFHEGQGFAQGRVVQTDCPVPPSRAGTTAGTLTHTSGAHSAEVTMPSETILVADAATGAGKSPDVVNFTNDLELDYPETPPTGTESLSPQVYLAKRHLGGYNALFADGHTKFFPYGTSQPKQWTVEED